MKMDVFDCIKSRRSVRKFLEVPVEWDKIGQILDAARHAPSAGNLQTWKFIVVRDAGKRHQLAEAALQQWWMEKAPIFIVMCAEMRRIRQFYGVRGERLYSIQSCAAAVQNMLLAAHNLGLGACWVSAFDEDRAATILSIPEDAELRPQAIIPIGYPDEKPRTPPRLPLENNTYLEMWSKQSLGKTEDLNEVLWNVRIGEKAIKAGKRAVESIDKMTEKQRKSLAKSVMEKAESVKRQIGKKVKKEKKP
jgi:nitroreductase